MGNLVNCFTTTVMKHPDKKAVALRDDVVTFEQLAQIARRYAATIKKALPKTSTNQPVGVFTNRDVNPVKWFMGAFYSHNFYVPIDPEMPDEKMKLLFEDAGFQVVLCGEDNKEKLAAIGYEGAVITPDTIGDDEFEDNSAQPQDPAYMIYTSGSTGKPKGVLKSHGSVLSFVEAYAKTFEFDADEIIGNQTPFYFDAAAKDLYIMIKTGATIEIIPTELFSGTTDLVEYMNQKKISFCSWVPTALSLVAQMCPFSMVKPEYLKKMFFVGEVMPMKHLNKWREYLPDVKYVNLYGQSELAGICCYYEVEKTFENTDTLPMGRPLCNSKVYLVDEGAVVNEPNRIGELYIVSDALATEYYNDADKTAASFIEKDFGEGPVRCFKTGDLAQYNEEGDLLFASRNDFQIKHMGRRIELGEIEVIAGGLPEVDRCCCLYNQEKKKIILFCQLAKECELTGIQIRSMLKEVLTSYMVPNKVVVLDALPINANGKIDRQALKTML